MLIAFKLKLVLACAAGLIGPLAAVPLVSDHAMRNGASLAPAMVELAPGALSYRAAGEFTRRGKVVEAPRVSIGGSSRPPLRRATTSVSSRRWS